MTTVFARIVKFSVAYPVTRGMASYAVIWPTGCLIQQLAFGDERFDFTRAARFGLFGAFYVAPTLNAWLTVARLLYPKNDLRSAIIKVRAPSVVRNRRTRGSTRLLTSIFFFFIPNVRTFFTLGAFGTSDVFTVRDGQFLFRYVFTRGQDGRTGEK